MFRFCGLRTASNSDIIWHRQLISIILKEYAVGALRFLVVIDVCFECSESLPAAVHGMWPKHSERTIGCARHQNSCRRQVRVPSAIEPFASCSRLLVFLDVEWFESLYISPG